MDQNQQDTVALTSSSMALTSGTAIDTSQIAAAQDNGITQSTRLTNKECSLQAIVDGELHQSRVRAKFRNDEHSHIEADIPERLVVSANIPHLLLEDVMRESQGFILAQMFPMSDDDHFAYMCQLTYLADNNLVGCIELPVESPIEYFFLYPVNDFTWPEWQNKIDFECTENQHDYLLGIMVPGNAPKVRLYFGSVR